MELSDWFKGFEKGISCLNPEQRTSFFSECGKNCVKCGTLQIYQELYEKANGNLDSFFQEADKLSGVRSEIIEEGSVYHLYFMECTCMLHRQGYVSTPLLCECSKQSILKDMFPHPYFVNVPNKVFFMSYIHYGKTRLFG